MVTVATSRKHANIVAEICSSRPKLVLKHPFASPEEGLLHHPYPRVELIEIQASLESIQSPCLLFKKSECHGMRTLEAQL